MTHINTLLPGFKHDDAITQWETAMNIKRLLIHLDHSQGCDNRLQTAIDLSRKLDARLTGVFVVPDYIVPSYIEAQISVDILTDVTEKAVARAREHLVDCTKLTAKAGVEMDARVVEGQLVSILREHSKYSDLLILGQDNPDDPDNTSYGLADTLLFEGACPCLVVPHSGKVPTPGERVLVAWNASRESARALREAVPLLQRAKEVVVLSSEPGNADEGDGHPHADELMRYLDAHGISAVTGGMGSVEMSATDVITAQAADMNADLIVMGGYGHARLREFILGGVTHDMLKQAPVSLFLAH